MNNFINFFIKNASIRVIKLVLAILFFLALISTIHAFRLANNDLTGGGIDFQFSPSVLFFEKINPFEYFLDGNFENKIRYAQWPSYAHLLYLIMYPFTFLDWNDARLVWSIVNFILAIVSVCFLSNKIKLNFFETLFVIFIFLSSSPFRNCITTGNFSFLILFIFLSYIINKNDNFKNFLLGISYIKYSFAPILFFTILQKNGIKGIFISILSCFFGWFFFSFYLEQNLFTTLLQPIKVSLIAFHQESSRGDLFTILNIFNSFLEIKNFDIMRIVIIFIVSFFISRDIFKVNDNFCVLSLLLISSLFCFPHLMYDFIVLLPAFILSISNKHLLKSKISILIISYFWFGLRVKDYIIYYLENNKFIISPISYVSTFQVFINFILLTILYLLIKDLKKKN